MIHLKSERDIEKMKESADIVGRTLGEVAKLIRPGVSLKTLDKVAETFIRDNGAVPSFKGYEGFPASLCLSVNDVVVHGIPKNQELRDGDIVSVDCGACKNGFHGDYCYTFEVGHVTEEIHNLCVRTKESLYKGIAEAVEGKRVGDIGHAIQTYVESFGYSVVREMVGHGCGRHMHEKPDVPNYGSIGKGARLTKGMVICIEPMINMGVRNIRVDKDGWTTRTADGLPSAHYEHMVAIRENGSELLSTYRYVEEVLNKKTA
ncbi:MAG: type I methionyl aminopeptidase [Bacteroidales bacterium]|nr:type I methionyl aminopeptidase [Bacteroidales bacterium]